MHIISKNKIFENSTHPEVEENNALIYLIRCENFILRNESNSLTRICTPPIPIFLDDEEPTSFFLAQC